jgi:copper homeostasis protein (lipoprotein)
MVPCRLVVRLAMVACCAAIVPALVDAAPTPPPLGPLPATFVGLLPCADCVAMRVQLDLLPDGAYLQRTTYLREGRDESFYEIGAWVLSSERTLVLGDGRDEDTRWSVEASGTLRKLDSAGREIVSMLPYQLTRAPAPEPMEPRVRLRGLFRVMPSGPRFSDCVSGLQWPVSREAHYGDLEQAYARQKKKGPAADLMVTLDARITTRSATGGLYPEPTLVVERFVRASPGAICNEQPGQMELANTRWRPLVLDGEPVVVAGSEREPWIELDPKAQRFGGYAGCNRLTGSWRAASGGRLRFTYISVTRMVCPRMEQEQAFIDALERTARYRIAGRSLELLDSNGNVLAKLEERNLD